MDRMKKAAILTRLIQKLRDQRSWCGETHIQKTAFFLQDLMDVPLGFDYILYKHGPFSFELRDELTALRADGLIGLEPHSPYGPRIAVTDQSQYIQDLYTRTLSQYDTHVSFVAEKLGEKGVTELERLATAFFVTRREDKGLSAEKRADIVTRYKPHISIEDAGLAVESVDTMIAEAKLIIQ